MRRIANKERNKRSARKARAEARAEREAAQLASTSANGSKSKKSAQQSKAVATKKDKGERRGPFKRIRGYFADVRTEMHRVVWPSRAELKNFTFGVVVMLIVFGVAIWLVDLGLVSLLSVFAGMRG